MKRARVSSTMRLIAALAAVSWGAYQGLAAANSKDQTLQMTPKQMMEKKVTPAQRKAAADRLKAARAAAAAAGASTTAALWSGPGGMVPDYFGATPNWAFSPPLAKFVDPLPDLKGLIAHPDTVTYPGSDYYEIALVEYTNWSFHASLPTTRLRGYKQTNNGTDSSGNNTVAPPANPSYLGPVILATKNRPTRIRFTNNLPLTGVGGNLFFPTDTTVMGAGPGPDGTDYPQNRGTLHLHGGFTPWVSDGTPHQWVTPAGEDGISTLHTGVSTQPVPDMVLPAGNSMTFYWPNQQSGRLMFYHDHALGITRLNVYAGEAAGYLLRDAGDTMLEAIAGFPGLASNIPLVIQDRTFVWGNPPADCLNPQPGEATGTFATDPTWCDPMRGWSQTTGSLWFPHVYMPNQNPWDISGANAMGRWDYALWFWPPYTGLINNDVLPNPYYGPAAPWEPPSIPGTPNPSLVPEAFMDTPVVNGKAYPTLSVPAGPVRFRILNAANDRFWNLSLFVAADKTTPTTAGAGGTARLCDGGGGYKQADCSEVKMVPFNSSQNAITPFPDWWYTPGLNFMFDDRAGGVPDPTTRGPAMIQIGNEGGLLPAPAVIQNQPINYTYNRRDIVVLSVQEHALLLGPAERADVIVDFTNFAGATLILYNDAPAPVPAADQRIDYYTGGMDQTSTGGAPPTLPGFGPNTRTIMRISVAGKGKAPSRPVDDVNTTLMTALSGPAPSGLPGAFAAFSDPIIVPQTAYNAAYPTSPTTADVPGANASRISDTSLSFQPLFAPAADPPLTINMGSKAIQELFEVDYGRMNATLGVELPFTNAGNQTTIPLGYIEPTTEVVDASVTIAPPAAGDNTQIWKITHNGVDTHAMHFHLFNVQVVNRVGWDGAIRLPDPNELGWKETVRMNPLEDIIVALRPTTPQLPFGIPDSSRFLAPALAPGAPIATFDTTTGQPITVTNGLTDFGWEYVWHCHLLGHEENDMMRPLQFNAPRLAPAAPDPVAYAESGGSVSLNWTDPTPFSYATALPASTLGDPANEIGFRIESSGDGLTWTPAGSTLANVTTWTGVPGPSGTGYRVVGFNAAGDGTASTPVGLPTAPLAPTNLVATLQAGPQVRLTWTDNASNETNFVVERWDGVLWTVLTDAVPPLPGTGTVTYADAPVGPGTYTYRVDAKNVIGPSTYATSNSLTVPSPPLAPASLTAVAVRAGGSDRVTLTWPDVASETGYTIERSTSLAFPAGSTTTFTVAANSTTLVQTVGRRLTLYYRIRAFNLGGPSGNTNAAQFPVTTP